VPLMAAAVLLLALAGGYLLWSQRQSPAAPAQTAQADAPKAVPAMAPQEPAANAAPGAAPAPPPAAAAATPDAATPPAASKEAVATAAATKEALAAKTPPPTAAAAAVKGATVQSTNARSVPPPLPTSVTAREPAARPAAAPPPPAPTISDHAAVVFRCSGAPDVCSSLRSNVNDALDKAGFRVVNSPDRADIAIGAGAGGLQEKVSQQFGQTFATRTYQIELSAEAPKLGDSVSMPPATTVTFDSTVGRERLEEKARLVASDVVDRVKAYIKKKHGA